jgi:hypothetical protein
MKSLLRNYIEKLTLDELKQFGTKHGINIGNDEYQFILDLVQHNWEDMLQNENKYLDMVEEKINPEEFKKIKDLFLEYKRKFKGYLF